MQFGAGSGPKPPDKRRRPFSAVLRTQALERLESPDRPRPLYSVRASKGFRYTVCAPGNASGTGEQAFGTRIG